MMHKHIPTYKRQLNDIRLRQEPVANCCLEVASLLCWVVLEDTVKDRLRWCEYV